jgi:hypothetical protein
MAYKIGDLVEIVQADEKMVRKMLIDCGVIVNDEVIDPDQEISFHDVVVFASSMCGTFAGNLVADFLVDGSDAVE